MLRTIVRAAVLTAALVAVPAASQAMHKRGDDGRACRICKMFSDTGDRLTRGFRMKRKDSLFALAPRERTAGYVRTERKPHVWPKRDPLFVLAPREKTKVRSDVLSDMFKARPRLDRISLFDRKGSMFGKCDRKRSRR